MPLENNMVYIQMPADKTKLLQLLNNAPVSILTADFAAVKWLDEVKRVANELK